MTKNELLKIMLNWGACDEAKSYVRAHRCEVASVIIDECDDTDWLIWLLGREGRLDRFVQVCDKRIQKYGNGYYKDRKITEEYFSNRAKAVAVAAAWNAYSAAEAAVFSIYYATHHSSREIAWANEREKQLIGLRRIGRDWADGLPAAKVKP